MLVFGPVPSRRLGRSVGINNIPPKICDYSCIYCQLGRSYSITTDRREYYPLSLILRDVDEKIKKAQDVGERIDYLTFVPDGEPTLDINLGKEIEAVKQYGIPTAVITNSTLLWREDVQNDLLSADLISIKIDAVDEKIWRKIDRPSRSLSLSKMMDGIMEFSKKFDKSIITETMLVKDVNDAPAHLENIALFLKEIGADISYISIPIRPPSESYVMPPDEITINMAYQIFSKHLENVEYLIGYEGNQFACTGDLKDDILSITSVHPMKKEAIQLLLDDAGMEWDIIDDMISHNDIIEIKYQDDTFYLRKLKK